MFLFFVPLARFKCSYALENLLCSDNAIKLILKSSHDHRAMGLAWSHLQTVVLPTGALIGMAGTFCTK